MRIETKKRKMIFTKPKNLNFHLIVGSKKEWILKGYDVGGTKKKRTFSLNEQKRYCYKDLLFLEPYFYWFAERISIACLNRQKRDLRFWGNISRKEIDSIVPPKTSTLLIDFMVKTGVIEINHSHSRGKFAKSYRLGSFYRDSDFDTLDLLCPAFEKKLKKQTTEYTGCVNNFNLLDVQFPRIKVEKEKQQRLMLYYSKVRKKDFHCSRSEINGRVFSTVTQMPRELRPFLSANGKRLVDIDMPNCAFLLFLAWLKKNASTCKEEVVKLEYYLTEKDFYGHFADKLKIDRKECKIKLLSEWLNKPPKKKNLEPVSKEFPLICIFLDAYKFSLKDWSLFFSEILKMESEVFIDRVCKRLEKGQIIAYSVHDGLLAEEGREHEAKQIADEEMTSFLGFSVQSRIKYISFLDENMKLLKESCV